MPRPEEALHFQICDYLRLAYPKVMFISESSGLRVSQGLAAKLKRVRSNHVHLDLYILKPMGEYHGLILELKAKRIHRKDDQTKLLKDDHLADQQQTIDRFNKLGYMASFAVNFAETKKIIDNYLNGNLKG